MLHDSVHVNDEREFHSVLQFGSHAFQIKLCKLHLWMQTQVLIFHEKNGKKKRSFISHLIRNTQSYLKQSR